MVKVLSQAVAVTEAPDPRTVPSHEGGPVFEATDLQRLMRFLISGTEAGTIYAGDAEVTLENVDVVTRMLDSNYVTTLRLVADISRQGRARQNDYAIFALAMALNHPNAACRSYAAEHVNAVCRTGAHLSMLGSYLIAMRPRGAKRHVDAHTRSLPGRFSAVKRRAVSSWFESNNVRTLVYQAIKYQEREGVSLRDLLILAHPKGGKDKPELAEVYDWIVRGTVADSPAYTSLANFEAWDQAQYGGAEATVHDMHPMARIIAFRELRRPDMTAHRAAKIVAKYYMPREAVPTEFLNDRAVWEALFESMPMTAMVRNLGKMTELGLLQHRSVYTDQVIAKLTDPFLMRASRLHPLNLYTAFKTYGAGKGVKSTKTWDPVSRITDALNDAFFASFSYLEASDDEPLLAIDVSGSMATARVSGLDYVTCAEGAAILAMAFARQFTTNRVVAYSDTMIPVDISANDRLDTTLRKLRAIEMGAGTFCSLPIEYALQQRIDVDCFVSITDSETWDAGTIGSGYRSRGGRAEYNYQHALRLYRNKVNQHAGAVVVAMMANKFSLADPTDPRQMDMVGFDSNGPALLQEAIAGWGTQAVQSNEAIAQKLATKTARLAD